MAEVRDGAAIHYRLAGEGAPLLLISGLNGRADFWDQVAARLTVGHKVLSFDQRGCGVSPDTGEACSVESLAGDAADLASTAFAGRPYAVVGHSTGGAIAQVLSATWPERVTEAVLSGTWAKADAYMQALFGLRRELLQRAPDLEPVMTELLRTPSEHFRAPSAVRPSQSDIARTDRRIRALLAHNGFQYLAVIRARTLVVGARDDRLVPPHLLRDLHANLAGSSLRLLRYGGHFFPRTRARAFAKIVREWLSEPCPS